MHTAPESAYDRASRRSGGTGGADRIASRGRITPRARLMEIALINNAMLRNNIGKDVLGLLESC